MECEQRGSLDREIALLKGLQGTSGNHAAEMGFRAATKRVAAMCLLQTNVIELSDSRVGDHVDRKLGNAACASFWRVCCGQGPPLPLDSRQTMIPPPASYSKELCLLVHVFATACPSNPASVCKTVEDFGKEGLAPFKFF